MTEPVTFRCSDDPRLVETTMYRAVCMGEGCDRSPQDAGEVHAWAEKECALNDAESDDWYLRRDLLLCPDCGYLSVCMHDECPRRDVSEADDGWFYCPDHITEGMYA